jgi:hypothetical protein
MIVKRDNVRGTSIEFLTDDQVQVLWNALESHYTFIHDGYDHSATVAGDKPGCDEDSLMNEKKFVKELIQLFENIFGRG